MAKDALTLGAPIQTDALTDSLHGYANDTLDAEGRDRGAMKVNGYW